MNDDLNLLTADEPADTTVLVQSSDSSLGPTKIRAYVDENNVVRQASNGACFNADAYEVVER